MGELDALEAAFTTAEPRTTHAAPAATGASITSGYDRRLLSLRKAEHGRYARCLDGGHDYPSDSEASLAVVDAMVARHYTDGEIWHTLEGTQLFASRVARKGEEHARHLYANEIEKARRVVTPFPRDPADRGPPTRTLKVAAPADVSTLSGNGHGADALQEPEPLSLPTGDDFISRYVRYAAQRTDAPLQAHELSAVVILSSLAGPSPYLPIATSQRGWRLCLWGMYVVNSTVGRKTTTINLAKEVIAEVLGREALIEWEGSPQGLIQRLQERDGEASVFARDEYSGLMAQMNRAGGHLAGLPQLFIKAFDGGVLENIRTRKKVRKDGPKVEDTDRVENPYLAKLTASTWDSFMERCTIDNVLDGYLARFIFVTGAADPKPLPVLTTSMQAEFDAIVDHATRFSQRARATSALEIGGEVIDLAWQLEQKWLAEAIQSSRPDAAGPAMKRLAEAVLKTAALLAIDESVGTETPAVTSNHFARALEFGGRWKTCTMQVVEALGSTSFMRDIEAVLSTVLAHPKGIQVRDLMRKHRRLRQRDFEEILDTLQTREQVEVLQVSSPRGRPPRIVYPFGHGPGQEAIDGEG